MRESLKEVFSVSIINNQHVNMVKNKLIKKILKGKLKKKKKILQKCYKNTHQEGIGGDKKNR